ncbi:hypothetical protein OIU77_004432 [Salix suchowensis]|uniref:Uncharacterized protein n=1 Tax=Salix suchowensis TaxID=1278906 RepID=A0ABQ9AVK0_9ROSI|nr:hypothetical protein OIU77_004432 [Salix suchowensis]
MVCISYGSISFSAHLPSLSYLPDGSEVQFTSATQCTYPRSPALGLGLIAAVTLTIAQVIINVATGCICCKRSQLSSNSNWTIAFVCFVVSW